MDRRHFIKTGAAFTVAAGIPFPLILSGGDNETFPSGAAGMRWIVYDDGSFDLDAGSLGLTGCFPAIDGRPVRPTALRTQVWDGGGRVTYQLSDGTLELRFGSTWNSLVLETDIEGMAVAPDWIHPLAGGAVRGADRFFKQGLGFAGPSGFSAFPDPPRRVEGEILKEFVWSYDSYLCSALLSPDEQTLAFGSLNHSIFLQRTTFYNRQYRFGLSDRHLDSDQVLVEAGFALENRPIPSDRLRLPELHFHTGNDAFLTLRSLAHRIASASGALTDKPTSTHYCSWYEHEKDFSMEMLRELTEGLKKMKPAHGLDAIQIDDGYCTRGDWLTANEKWPEGMKKAFSQIRSAGCRPGIWVAPFMVSSKSELFRLHPDWLLRDMEGKAIIESRGEKEDMYILDSSHPAAFNYLRGVFRSLYRWGARFFKTDFMDWGFQDSLRVKRHTPGKTSMEYFVEVIKMIREEIGSESFWLGCISPFAPMIGYVDAMRVANDLWQWTPGSVGNMLRESMAGQYMNQVFWQNDPDVVYLRSYSTGLTRNERISIALWAGMLGGVVNTSDRLPTLSQDELRYWRFIRPGESKNICRFPYWTKNDRCLVAVRSMPAGNAWALLVLNPLESSVSESMKLTELTGKGSLHCYRWEPGRFDAEGQKTEITLSLEPHASALFYLSTTDRPPDANTGLHGYPVEGLTG